MKHEIMNIVLMDAVSRNDVPGVQQAINNGIDMRLYGDDCVSVAAHHGHVEMMDFLIDQGADVHHFGEYALRKAAGAGHDALVEFLIEKGADVGAMENMALAWAARSEHESTFALLLENGASYADFSEFQTNLRAFCEGVSQTKLIERQEKREQDKRDDVERKRNNHSSFRNFIRRRGGPRR